MTNADQETFWTHTAGHSWVAQQAAMDATLRPILDAVLLRAALQPAEHVLDVGCGTGDSVLAAASAVGPEGHVTGLDISDTMLARAQARLAPDAPVTLLKADAQTHEFDHKFDAIISRFGVMFFDDFVAAFANMRHALRPAGRMVFGCWGPAPDNPFFMEPAAAARAVLGPMPKVDRTLPGPFALENVERITSILEAAGWRSIEIATQPIDLTPPDDLNSTAELCTRIGPAQSALRHHEASEAQRVAVEAAIRDRFAPMMGLDGLRIPSRIHIVHATTP